MNTKRTFYRLVVGTMLMAVLGAAFTYDSLAYTSQPVKISALIPQVEILAVIVDPSSGLTTTESGGQATFDIYLDLVDPPPDDVIVTLVSSNTNEGTVDPPSMTFTPVNYGDPQTATVTGVDDDVVDGDQPYTIDLTSTEGNPSVSVTNLDDDASLTLEKTVISDDGGTAVIDDFQAYLDGIPVDWGVPQIITAGTYTASEDNLAGYTSSDWGGDCDAAGSVTLAAGDAKTCSITNDDIAPTLTLEKIVISDDGGTAVEADFQAYLDGNPVDWGVPQIITAGAHTASEDTLLGYIPSDWGDDCGTDGSVILAVGELKTCTITNDDADSNLTLFKNVTNNDGGTAIETDFQAYIDATPVDWSVLQPLAPGTYTVSEVTLPFYNVPEWSGDCAPGGTITVSEGQNLTCTITNDDLAVEFASASQSADESNPTMSVTVQLSDISDFDVTVPYIISGTAEEGTDYTITPSPLVIPSGEVSGVITITVIDDHSPENDEDIILTMGTPINAFPGTITEHTATILNDDIVGVTVEPTTGLLTSEDGLSDTFTVVLDTQPTANVTIGLSSSDTSEGTIDKSSLTFTPANWDTPQEVTITGIDDYFADGDVVYTVITGPITTTDPDYATLDPVIDIPDVEATNADNDTAGITITPNSGWTTEAGVSMPAQVLVKTKPTSQVTLNFSSNKPNEGTVTPTNIIVSPEEWNPGTPYQITIVGIDDINTDGDINYKVSMQTTSSDPDYGGINKAIQMVNYDAPTIEWVYPVGDGKIYEIDNLVPIRLRVRSVGNEPISKVRFYRWDVNIGNNVTIGDDSEPAYQVFLDPADLNKDDYNQVWAFAYGTTKTPDDNLTYSKHKRILIYRRVEMVYRNYLPLIFRFTK